MKIFEIIPQMTSGGAERFVLDLCNELSKSHDVYLIVFFTPSSKAFYVEELNTNVKLISLDKKKGFSFRIFLLLYKLINEHSPDIIHTHIEAISYIFPYPLIFCKAQFYHTLHSDAYFEASSRSRRLLRKILFSLKLVKPITISNGSHKSFCELYGMNTPVIPNGRRFPEKICPSIDAVEEMRKIRRLGGRVVICPARFCSVKRHELTARVAKKLHDEGIKFQMVFMGAISETEIVDRINETSATNVHIIGEKCNPLDYMALSDAYCLFSECEGLPISLIEAISIPLIPICTPVGGIPEIITPEVGFLSEDITEDSCFNALKEYLLTPDAHLSKYKQHARNTSSKFNIEQCAKFYEILFLNTRV